MNKENININDIYVVNPKYKLRNDVKRVRVGNNNSLYCHVNDAYNEDIMDSFSWIIHPYLAYLLSEFTGERTLKQICEKLSDEFDLPENELLESFLPLIYNSETVFVPVMNISRIFPFPKNFLVKKEKDIRPNVLSREIVEKILAQDLDLTGVRAYIPDSMTFMLNNKCVVDCEYCYADKSVKVTNPLPFARVKEIISEAASLGIRNIDVNGGEFFLYPYWEELIDELRKYDYEPYISTKHPLTEDMVNALVRKNIKAIQLSVDSVNSDELKKMLNVGDDYLVKVKKGVELLNKAKIEIAIKPVITKYNDSIESVKNLLDYFSQFEMVECIRFAPGTYSIYKPFTFSSTVKKIDEIKNFIEKNKAKYHFKTVVQGEEVDSPIEEKREAFPNRSLCSGNQSTFLLLPDGKVTLCEQLYWHPFFIMGDLSLQSIMEVWNGEKALALWNYSQEEVREESPCKQCDEFDDCRRGKGNCWRVAIAAYGNENYDYPSPNCPKSLPVTRPYFMPNE
ncbi:MAG: radical SAM protein [Bacteroidales bacterium]|jgi:radical SAM protein with 4Fe4S-binding SPASM domain|nr:radical SAM protein [Bacteroidales bacterium]